MAIMAAAAIIGIGTSIYQTAEASDDKKKAERDLANWEKTHKQDFKTAEQIALEAKQGAEGYTPAEKAAFQQALARRSNKAYQLATDRNPNLSGAVTAGINYGNIGSLLSFAAQDAQIKRQDKARRTGLIQGQDTRQTMFNQQVAGQYGQAIQQQKENVQAGLNNIGYNVAGYGYYMGEQDKEKPPATPSSGGASTGYKSPTDSNVGSDSWARSMYGNPNPQAPTPQFYGAKTAAPYTSNWMTDQYFTTPY